MSNTLAELQQECEKIGRRLTYANLPLKMYGKNCQVKLELCGDNGNYWVEVRSSIDLDEKVAIIMQMFEDGNNDSIAMEVANKIKQRTIDKACEWMEKNMFEKCEFDEYGNITQTYACSDSCDFVSQFVEQFRKAMEE